MKSIQVLDRGSTKAIVSTQVIPTLWAALKELIENALDAQATWIDISITEYGTGTIEVQDDGCGISEELMSSFTQLNFTTKIRSFRDIHDVHTYGFRGEAVASLCHLCSELQISSRREHAAGCTVVFQEGVLVRKSATDDELGSRAHGTNIRMSGLFNTLPVRRKHFEAKAKREFSSLLLKAQEYALLVIFQSFPHLETSCINAKARIRFIHNGKVIVAPQVLGRPLDVVTSVLGPKIAKCMHEISWPFSVHASTSAPLSSHTVGNEMVYHDGLDSKAGNEETFSSEGMFFGMMGVTSARCGIQYIYLDGRPVEIPKLGKLFNATIALDCGYLVYVCTLHLRRGERDVNMTIDKRTISLRDENEILSALQQHLIAFLSKIQHTSHQLKAMTYVPAIWTPSKSTDSKWTPNSSPGTVPSPCTEPEASGLNSQASKHKSVNTTFPIFNRNKRPREYFASQESKFSDVESDFSSQSLKSIQNSQSVDKVGHIFDTTVDSPPTTSIFDELTFSTTPRDSSSKRLNGEFNLTGRNSGSMRSASVRDDSADRVGTGCSPGIKREGSCCSPRTESTDTSSKNLEIPVNSQRTDDEHSVIYDDHEEVFESQVVYTIPVRPYQEGPTQKSISKENRELLVIRQESIHSQVGESLLTIGDFESMEVMGQFNSGFIITRFGKDLYIVDQHAADEKKNFELLMANAKEHLRPQKLIIPRVLSPAISARIDQLEMQTETLRKNGIILRVNDSLRTGASMRDVYLLATPSSMGVTYSDSEVEELIIDICDGLRAHDSIRLAGTLRHAMATKACRKSIMIGTVLSDWQLKNIVHRLAWLEHPWNCPHGRPTIRRIASLEWGD